MWPFHKRCLPRPVPGVAESIAEINSHRLYALEQIRAYYEQIVNELSNTDPETLEKITAILDDYNHVEDRVQAALNLMDAKINALQGQITTPSINLAIKPVYNPASKSLSFLIEGGVK